MEEHGWSAVGLGCSLCGLATIACSGRGKTGVGGFFGRKDTCAAVGGSESCVGEVLGVERQVRVVAHSVVKFVESGLGERRVVVRLCAWCDGSVGVAVEELGVDMGVKSETGWWCGGRSAIGAMTISERRGVEDGERRDVVGLAEDDEWQVVVVVGMCAGDAVEP